jgi:predicted PurR-regulated permease PerM
VETSSPDDATSKAAVEAVNVQAVALTIVACAGAIYGLRVGVSLFAPVLVSVLLAYAIEPLVRTLCRCRLPRTLAVLTAYGSLVVALAAAAVLARRQVLAFADLLPAAGHEVYLSMNRTRRDLNAASANDAAALLRRLSSDINATFGPPTLPPPRGVARVARATPALSVRTYLGRASIAIGIGAMQLIAIGLLTLFLLLGGEALKRTVIAIAGARAKKKVTYDVIKAIDRQIERYLIARLQISAIVAAATWFGLWCLGLRQPLALGVLAGALNVLPFIGPAVAVALIGLVAFVQFHAIGATTAAVVVAGTVAALEGNLISPWLTGRAGELNTVAVFVSVLFWGWLWDMWGLALAIPIMVAIKAAADHIDPLQPLGELLGR